MDTIDRLGWADGLSFESYGLSLGVRATSSDVIEAVKQRLPPGWRRAPSPLRQQLHSIVVGGPAGPSVRRFNVVYAGAMRIARTLDLEEALDAFENDVKLYVAERARRFVFVHAGVVGLAGRAILIPGRSRSGKSRLVEALVRAGCTYYSDEYAVLDARGRVHPYPAPLKIRGGRNERISRIELQELSGRVGRRPLMVGLVVIAAYRPGARWQPRRLSAGQGVLALLDNTVPARRRPSQSLRALREAVRDAVILRGSRGEAAETATRLIEEAGEASERSAPVPDRGDRGAQDAATNRRW